MPEMSAPKRRKIGEGHTPAKLKSNDRISKSAQPKLSNAAVPTPKALTKPAKPAVEEEEDVGNNENTAEEPVTDARKSFQELGVVPELCDMCREQGYTHPTPIQAESIPVALEGRDIIGLAETGSGKTCAFALPVLQALLNEPPKQQAYFGLVLAPTRELAFQISQQFKALGALIQVEVATIVGGMDMTAQAIALAKRPHVIVATPGRLLDHLENTKGFSLRNLRYLVMDEADRILDLDFGPVMDKIPPRENRHTYLFSATMSSKLDSLTRASLHNPVKISISTSSHQTVSTLLQYFIFIPHKHKDLYLVHLLNDFSGHPCIVFTRTVNETQRLAFLLRNLGFGAIPIHGQLSQNARLAALGKFKDRSRNVLIATDVAARGLDIQNVDLVVNYDLPSDSKTYVHRVGRTARAGKSGKAVSLVTQYDVEIWMYESPPSLRIENALGKKLEEYQVVKDEVMVLSESVGEAQRRAIRELKDMQENGMGRHRSRKGPVGKKGKRGRDEMDAEEG
ncbi:ribosomal RNA processing protein [Coniosporium tulheliwenetii]|uniref:Ribosomal RNA processing protein n=1 Tax=Coniosporium tulheliwenetii TaxID=3383036 RepID=A0ACC2ZPW2_9PEZI|nr:ribosomal RNA processing protein [Cladosporium sp. JES 115]